MSGLFDDEGKTAARGRKHRAPAEATELLAERPGDEAAELASEVIEIELENKRKMAEVEDISPGHPFEDSIKAAAAIADDLHPEQGVAVHKNRSLGPSTVNQHEQVNRFPISQERRAKLLNLVWERTRWRTGRVEWRDFRELLKDVIELL